jgi:VanZ family protein
MALIFALSSTARLPDLSGGTDKQLHGLAYGVLAILVARARTRGHIPALTAREAAVAWAVATLYGATDEMHQAFVPGRTADWMDVGADAAGAFAAVSALWACGIIARSMQARSRPGR